MAAALEAEGYAVIEGFLPDEAARALAASLDARYDAREFRAARVGAPGAEQQVGSERSDSLLWLDPAAAGPEQHFGSAIDSFGRALRERLRLPIQDGDFHATVYEPGAFYRRHVDVSRGGRSRRLLSCVYYLNADWTPENAGALRIHGAFPVHVEPRWNRLVVFRSVDIEHEVEAPVGRRRLAVTGWLLGG